MLVACVILACLAGEPAAHAAQRAMQLVKSKHYLIHSDLDDAQIYELGTRMEAMYGEYSRRLADFDLHEDRKPLDVYLFDRKQDYMEFTGGQYENTGGVFMPAWNQLAAYLEGQRDTLRRTLQHEAFHQFAQKALRGNMPIWLNEGMAQLFEEAIWTGDAFLMGQVPPRRVRQLQLDLKDDKLLPLKQLMSMTGESWSHNLTGNASLGSTQYNQSWAIVHYMAYGERGANGAKLVALLQALRKGKDQEDAFRDAFGPLAGFKAAFEKYATQLESTPEAELIDRHEALADLLAKLAAKGKRFSTVSEFRRNAEASKYKLQYWRGQVSWDAEPAEYFRDAQGRPFAADEMYLEDRKGAPLPDLVLRHPAYRIGLRARFYERGDEIEQEVVVEGRHAGATATIER
ncbi:MAG TPA: DUF1570 domain-containing protein [Tepidisphaeraceae bacterium]|jgi:hypothetical protein